MTQEGKELPGSGVFSGTGKEATAGNQGKEKHTSH